MKKKTDQRYEVKLKGRRVVSGMCMGPAFLFYNKSFQLTDLSLSTADTEREIIALKDAISNVITLLQDSKNQSKNNHGQNFADVFDAQIAILEDNILFKEVESYINTHTCSAAYAVFNVFQQKREHFQQKGNIYFKDRAFDVQDVMTKLLSQLTGEQIEHSLSRPSIIFADTLSPADTVHFPRELVLGFVTDRGGITSHTAIISRALHIPYVISPQPMNRLVENGDYVLLDGYQGNIVLNPGHKTKEGFKSTKKKYERIYTKLCDQSKVPAITTDGIPIEVMANVELIPEMEEALTLGADGIGLLRTEVTFLEAARIPDEQEQVNLYRKFSEGMIGKSVIIRTIDAGGDKILTPDSNLREDNPFLGWRAIRFCLDQPHIFKTQLRAILRANTKNNLKIMIPMISCMNEILQTRKLLEQAKAELQEQKIRFNPQIELGIMVEIPSAALLAARFAEAVDFMSIGTNDLTQYTLAVDRTNSKIAHLFNDLHPAVLLLMQTTKQAGQRFDKKVSICGELAGNPEAIAILLGMGFTNFSLSPSMIPIIKKVIRSLSVKECTVFTENLLLANSAQEVKEKAIAFLEKYLPGYQGLL